MKEKKMLLARFGHGGEVLISKEDLPRLTRKSEEMIRMAMRPGSGMTEKEAQELYSFEILREEE